MSSFLCIRYVVFPNRLHPARINNFALKLPREPVSGLLGIKPFATNKNYPPDADRAAG
jgi:hypothetical protein